MVLQLQINVQGKNLSNMGKKFILFILCSLALACGGEVAESNDAKTTGSTGSSVSTEATILDSSSEKASQSDEKIDSNQASANAKNKEKTTTVTPIKEAKDEPASASDSNEPTPSPTPTPLPKESNSATPTPSTEASSAETKVETKAVPTPTPSRKPFPVDTLFPLDFSPSSKYEEFSTANQEAFKNAVKINFDKATQKAGVNAAVFDGTRLWTGAEGIASATSQMTPTTPMIIRSTSKTMLGAFILSQIERGLYSLDDTISSLLSDHPDYDLINIPNVNTEVTVKQLLTMTSGISDWSKPEDIMKRMSIMSDQNWKPANNLKYISKKFTSPGSYSYSYANSIILGLIASHYEKKNLNDVYQEQFFRPLGLTAGLLPEIAMPEQTAIAYDDLSLYQGGSGFGALNTGLMSQFYGLDPKISWAGAGIVSTPENIARWGYELYSSSGSAVSSVVRNKLIQGMTIPTDAGLTSLGMHTYGYYMGTGEVALPDRSLLKIYTHPGGGGGRTSWLYYSPELNVSISLLANSQMLHNPGSCGHRGNLFMTAGECIAGSMFNSLKK